MPVVHPRHLLTAVPDDEQLKEVIVVAGHAGSRWVTPAWLAPRLPFALSEPNSGSGANQERTQIRQYLERTIKYTLSKNQRAFSLGVDGVSSLLGR